MRFRFQTELFFRVVVAESCVQIEEVKRKVNPRKGERGSRNKLSPRCLRLQTEGITVNTLLIGSSLIVRIE